MLNQDFISELIKSWYQSEKLIEICKKNLKFQYLQTESQKKIVKFIFDNHTVTGNVPTIGTIGQKYNSDPEVITALAKIKVIKRVHIDDVLKSLEDYIRKVRFQQLTKQVVELFNAGSHDEAIDLQAKESKEINEFALKQNYYAEVFTGFADRQKERKSLADQGDWTQKMAEACTSGIHELDDHIKGGFRKGKSACILARSGKGKSTWLRWIGLCNARMGMTVVHFQAEGSEKECLDNYDAAWTGLQVSDLEFGTLPSGKQYKIYKTNNDIIQRGGRIFVYASETFESMSLHDAREIMLDIEALHGPIDMALFDYATLFQVKGDFKGESGERRRIEKVCQQITNIAVEFKCAAITAMQANDIAPKDFNRADFVLTRHHISEFKAAVQAFSYFLTLNGTDDEYDNGICRIYEDKFRDHKSGRQCTIYQSLENGRFYDSKRTIEEFYAAA